MTNTAMLDKVWFVEQRAKNMPRPVRLNNVQGKRANEEVKPVTRRERK
jgi:hypothetical protein